MGFKVAQKTFSNWKILRGDKVIVLAGRDKGLTGTVQRVLRDVNKVVVGGRNLVKKSIRRTEEQPGGIVTMEHPIHVSNVSLVDPTNGSPCRVSHRLLEDGTKVRVSVGKLASGAVIPRPELLKERKATKELKMGVKDTDKVAAGLLTWDPKSGDGGLPPLVKMSNGKWRVDFEALQ